MKIALIAPTYLPSGRANTIQVMKMAQALTCLGHSIQVLVPGKFDGDSFCWDDLAHHYGLQESFEIEWLPTQPGFRSYDYGLKSVRWAQHRGMDLIYTRLPQAAAIASAIGFPTIYEVHDLPQGTLGPWLFTRFSKGQGARALVIITRALKEVLTSAYSLPKSLPMVVAPDGVDLSRYRSVLSSEEARQAINSILSIPESTFVVGYTGHLYHGRGTELILDIAEQLPDICFLLAGGDSVGLTRIRQKIHSRCLKNVTTTGFIPNAELPLYQAACDILLLPYQRTVAASSGGDIAKYLSPMKLFEYLACGRAILSSDLPVLREILNPDNAILLPSDDSIAWVTAIRELRAKPDKRAQLATKARKDAHAYSWDIRAQNILSTIKTNSSIHGL